MGHKGGHRKINEACILHTAVCKKSTCWAEVMSNCENIKPIAVAVNKVQLFEGISQSVSRRVLSIYSTVVTVY